MASAVVTTQPQPCQRYQDVEQETLTGMANPKVPTGLGDWPASPHLPLDYGYSGSRSTSCRQQHEQAWAAKHLAVGWGLQWLTIGMLMGDCQLRQAPKARRDLQGSKKPAIRGPGGVVGGSNTNGNDSSGAGPRKLSDCTLIATVQVLLGSQRGTTSRRRVTFNTAPEVKHVETCRVLYPSTLEGIQMKREAFWSKTEVHDNQVKWDGHLETYELGRNGCGTACKCHGCVVDGEDTNF